MKGAAGMAKVSGHVINADGTYTVTVQTGNGDELKYTFPPHRKEILVQDGKGGVQKRKGPDKTAYEEMQRRESLLMVAVEVEENATPPDAVSVL